MAVTTTVAMSKTFEVIRQNGESMKVSASFNGKIYHGKRYIKCQYRINSTKSGLKEATWIWQDGFGWVEGGPWGSQLVELFGLE